MHACRSCWCSSGTERPRQILAMSFFVLSIAFACISSPVCLSLATRSFRWVGGMFWIMSAIEGILLNIANPADPFTNPLHGRFPAASSRTVIVTLLRSVDGTNLKDLNIVMPSLVVVLFVLLMYGPSQSETLAAIGMLVAIALVFILDS